MIFIAIYLDVKEGREVVCYDEDNQKVEILCVFLIQSMERQVNSAKCNSRVQPPYCRNIANGLVKKA